MLKPLGKFDERENDFLGLTGTTQGNNDLTFEDVAIEPAEGIMGDVEKQQVLNAGESTVLHMRQLVVADV